ncbi:MAG: VOC family protein [Hyphomicrobiales bacterium]
MSDSVFVIFYVEDPAASAAFYTPLLGREPVESSPTFVLYALAGGLMFGLWGRAGVEPAVEAAAGACELTLPVGSPDEVDATFKVWTAKGVPMLQAPVRLDFGHTFTAVDPDGHRLRVFSPAMS